MRKIAFVMILGFLLSLCAGCSTTREVAKVHYEIIVDIKGFKWMIQSTDYVAPDALIGLYIEPDAIHIMKKSKYSGMFGDYSTFSDEIEQLSDIDTAAELYKNVAEAEEDE